MVEFTNSWRPGRGLGRRLALTLLLTSALAPVAFAGSFRLLPEAETPPAAPQTPALVAPAAPEAPATAAKPAVSLLPVAQPATAAPVAASAAPSNLVPFEQGADRLEFTGEDDTTVLTFYASAEQVAAGGSLQIAYRNAVSVLPDTGTIDVGVNGRPAGSFAIRSPNGVKLENLPISASSLKIGRNEVTLRARQRHRVDCSIDATYELWTRLDPALSGFMAGAPMRFSALEELMGVGRNAAGVTDIRLVVAKGASAATLSESAGVVQALGLFLNRDDLVVSVGETGGQGPGIDLYVGSASDRMQTEEGKRLLSSAPAGLSLRPGPVAGRAEVFLQGATGAERTANLLAALRGPMRAGLESGVISGRWGELAGDAGKSFTLKEAGYVTTPFTGRLARTDFDLRMPADFYPADYDTIDFYLHGATAPGLALGAKLLVRVNDRVVTSLPLRDSNGEQFNRKRIKLPMRSFRPGVNRIDIMAELPVAADAVCAPQMAAQEKPRFILLDDSTLEIPALARLGRLPDLGALSGSAYPFADGKPFDVFIDSQEPSAIAGALTTLTHLSLAARKPLGAEIRFGAPAEEEGRNALVIATRATPVAPSPDEAPATNSDPFAGFGGQATPPAQDKLTTGALDAAPAQPPANTQALLEAFQESTAVDQSQAGWTAQVQTRVVSMLSRFRHWLNYEDPAAANASTEAGALLTVSQSLSPTGLSNWTTLRAASAGELEQGVAMLSRPGVWPRLEGGRATIQSGDGALVSLAAADRVITGFPDPSFGNLRRLAAAWFSDNFQIYIVLVLVLMGGFGAWLGLAVPKKGVRTDQ